MHVLNVHFFICHRAANILGVTTSIGVHKYVTLHQPHITWFEKFSSGVAYAQTTVKPLWVIRGSKPRTAVEARSRSNIVITTVRGRHEQQRAEGILLRSPTWHRNLPEKYQINPFCIKISFRRFQILSEDLFGFKRRPYDQNFNRYKLCLGSFDARMTHQ